eukprot:3975935-Pleurochrysis_carterae.AAC.3
MEMAKRRCKKRRLQLSDAIITGGTVPAPSIMPKSQEKQQVINYRGGLEISKMDIAWLTLKVAADSEKL